MRALLLLSPSTFCSETALSPSFSLCHTTGLLASMPVQAAVSAPLPRQAVLSTRSQRRRRAVTVQISSYLTRHSSEQLQRSVMAFCQAVNAHDLDKLHSYLSPKCVWSDRVWSSVDLVGAAKVRTNHRSRRRRCRRRARLARLHLLVTNRTLPFPNAS